jgi:hypothetical protein
MDLYAITTQEVLERISRHCPEALSVYLQCINRADENGVCFFTKEMVEIDMSEEWRDFRKNVKKLARENLLEWHPFNNSISITLADQNVHK